MRKLLLAFSSLFFSLSAHAQVDFRPGYIVQLSGDTLRGQVDYRGAQRSAHLTRFRSAIGGSVTDYTPVQLRGYGFASGKQYQTELVALAGAAPESFFLEAIVLGPVSLLSLRSKDDVEHLYLRKGTQLQELIQRVEETVVNDTRYLHNTNELQHTLASTMQDCPVVQPSIARLRYSLGSLAAVVRQYNACKGEAAVAGRNPDEQNAFQFALMVGGQTSKLDIRRLNANNSDKTIDGKAQPTVGVAAHIALVRLNPHLGARIEALYSPLVTYKTEYDYRGATDLYTTHYQMEVKQSSIRIPVLLRYTLATKRVQPFVQAGVSGNILLQLENRERTRFADRPAFPEYTAWRPIVEKPRKFEQGILGGVGLSMVRASGRSLSAEVRYEHTNGFSDNTGTPTNVYRYSVLLSYSLTN